MRQKKKIKPKIKKTKLNDNPLFVKFLNWKRDKHSIILILNGILEQFSEDSDKNAVLSKIDNLDDKYLDLLDDFQNKFKAYITQAVTFNNVSEEFLFWLNNSFKYIEEEVETYAQDETRKIRIKEPSGRWLEALICYNFILTFNYFGLEIIKKCPICESFFSHKGKYARYCSDSCKERGMKNRIKK